MKVTKFMEPDMNAIMDKVFANTNHLIAGDGNSIVVGSANAGKTFRLLYEAICRSELDGKVLVITDESERPTQTKIKLIMEYIGLSKNERDGIEIEIHTTSHTGMSSHLRTLELAAEYTKGGDFAGVFIDLMSCQHASLDNYIVEAINNIKCMTCVAKQSTINAHFSGEK